MGKNKNTDLFELMGTFPHWTNNSGRYECSSDQQCSYAVACQLVCGFNLPEFDLWATSLPDCDKCETGEKCCLKQEMRERRKLALEALFANNKDAAFRHLEWMLNRKRADVREQTLIPLAKTGGAAKEQRKKAGENSGKKRGNAKKQKMQKAKDLWEKYSSEKPTESHTFVGKIANQLGIKSHTTVRGYLTELGINWNKNTN